MVRVVCAGALLSFLCACGGGGGEADTANPNANLPANAVAMQASTQVGMKSAMARMTTYEAGLMFTLNPGSALTQGVVVQPDNSAGVAPFSVTFAGNLAGDFAEPAQTRVTGKATFANDPSAPFNSVAGTAAIDVTILGVMSVYHADLAFTIGASERTASGKGVLTNPVTGNKTTMTVDAANPVRLVLATDPTSNVCGYVVTGDVGVVVAGPLGTYASTWHFTPGKPTVTVDGATHTDSMGVVTAMPATEADLRCNNAGAALADWVGVYRQTWGCLPYELGSAKLTLTIKDATTVTINDEDPPGSGDIAVYEASIVGSSARSVRGFFLSGPVGARYREDFNWTLSPDGKRFVQASRYVWQDGPQAGRGGNCFAIAVKQ